MSRSLIDGELDAARLCLSDVLDAFVLGKMRRSTRDGWDIFDEFRCLVKAMITTRDRRNRIATLSGEAGIETAAQTLARAERLHEESQRLKDRLERLDSR